VPLVVDDPPLPAWLLNHGQPAGWVLRDMVVTRLLFETGGRISEVTGLTLGDWDERGLQQEASISAETAKLRRRYCDGKRRPARPA
jgi:integrase